MTNVEALKALYVALGNEAADVENANTIVDVLNAIAAKYEGKDDATTNSEGIENITAVLDNIIPEPVPSENNAKFAATPAAFRVHANLVSVDIPEGVTEIAENAFQNCTALTNIAIPDGITSIGNAAFNNCKALINIDIPNGVTSIAANAFYGCTALKNVTISNNVTSIGSLAFHDCTSLETITIDKPKGSITGAPWGAPSTTQIIWNG